MVNTMDPRAAARWAGFTPAETKAVSSPWLHEEVARRMEQRLQWIVRTPRSWVHWEPLRGGLQAQTLLTRRYPKSECFVVETHDQPAQAAHKSIAKPWWAPAHWWGTPVHFEEPKQPVQMLWANMGLHMQADPKALIARWHSLLEVDGFLMFSCLGPETLHQLRQIYARRGWPAPAHEFTDMHDWGDMLVEAGFAEPVMDMEFITLTFETPQRLLQELRTLGRNLHGERFQGLRGRQWQKNLQEVLASELTDPTGDGRLPLRFEVIYGHAFKPTPRLTVHAQSTISLQQMRGALGLARQL